jgi:8-oxo-dGTP pyrophosphatase MutT (NUDIX family)
VSTERHFTATGFVVRDGRTLLHWHRKLQQWMPPGGHLLPGEDPVAGVLREIEEETGLRAEVIAGRPAFDFAYPEQVAPPFTIMIEDIDDAGGRHQHIDLIYFCRTTGNAKLQAPNDDDVLLWVDEAQLLRNEALPLGTCGLDIAVAEDVRVLAIEAIRAERAAAGV